jgi:pyruvate-formate lyase-activating enzyme
MIFNYNTIIMDEIEIISSEENKTKVQNLSIEELQDYKRELKEMIKFLENEIIKRKDEKIKAEKFFQK